MNGSRISRTWASLLIAVAGWSWLHSHLEAEAPPRKPSASETKAQAAITKASAPTPTITGRAVDEHGTPVAGAIVWLTQLDDSDFDLPATTVIAECQTRADGRFELAPLPSELKSATDCAITEFEIWIYKSGLAVGRQSIYGPPPQRPIVFSLENDSPVEIHLKNATGSACQGALATPCVVKLHDDWAIPQPIQEQLRVRSTSDGRLRVSGFNGGLRGVRIETPDFGAAVLTISPNQSQPIVASLPEVRVQHGRVLLPEQVKTDLSRIEMSFRICSNKGTCSERPLPGGWRQECSIRPDREGRFTIRHVFKHGTARWRVRVPDDIALFPSTGPGPLLGPFVVPPPAESPFEIVLWKGILGHDIRSRRTNQTAAVWNWSRACESFIPRRCRERRSRTRSSLPVPRPNLFGVPSRSQLL
jgi:hypothetical protein